MKIPFFIPYLFLALTYLWFPAAHAQSVRDRSPLQIAQLVADNMIEKTNFQFSYQIQPVYPDAEVLDFGKSISLGKDGIAYALTTFYSETDQLETIEIGFSNGIKVWVNDSLVYEKRGSQKLDILFSEKTYQLPEKFTVRLKEGANKVLIKSECRKDISQWIVILQSNNLGRYNQTGKKIYSSLKDLAPDIKLSNWLMLGPFPNSYVGNETSGLDVDFEPEHSIKFFKIYDYGENKFTWNIPRINIVAENPLGGKFYSWNYHVGCSMWGLQRLSEETGNIRYKKHVNDWCDYIISTIPLSEYQTKELHAFRSSNWSLVQRPMLDYTTAPAMPFLYRLISEKQFANRENYVTFTESIIEYAAEEQFRTKDGAFAREYTIDPSVWADDMFMGLPWLVYSSLYTNDPVLRKSLLDDAASQVLTFSKYLFDNDVKLYRQACYPARPDVKVPYWSRGNGWALWAESEILMHLPKNHPQYKNILKLYQLHIDGIVNFQDSDGFWHNLVNDPATVRESSGNAIFVLAIARGINQGWISKNKYYPSLIKGWNALITFIDEEGNIHGVKGGTNFSADPEDYAKTPVITGDTHGILPLLFACIEMNKLLD